MRPPPRICNEPVFRHGLMTLHDGQRNCDPLLGAVRQLQAEVDWHCDVRFAHQSHLRGPPRVRRVHVDIVDRVVERPTRIAELLEVPIQSQSGDVLSHLFNVVWIGMPELETFEVFIQEAVSERIGNDVTEHIDHHLTSGVGGDTIGVIRPKPIRGCI